MTSPLYSNTYLISNPPTAPTNAPNVEIPTASEVDPFKTFKTTKLPIKMVKTRKNCSTTTLNADGPID